MADDVQNVIDVESITNPIEAADTSEIRTSEAAKAVDTYLKTDKQVSTQDAYNNPALDAALNPVWEYQPKTPQLNHIFKRSPEMAKVITPEASMWDETIDTWRAFKVGFSDRAALSAQRSEAAFRIMEARNAGKEPDHDDKIKISALDEKIQALNAYSDDSPVSSALGDAAGAFAYNVGDNAPYILLATGVGSVLGGPVGGRAVLQASTNLLTADAYYRQGAGDFWLSRKMDPENKLNDDELYNLSQGLGLINGVVGALGGRYAFKQLGRSLVTPATTSFFASLGRFATDSSIDALSGLASSLSNILGEKISRKEDINFQTVILENQDRILQEMSIGVAAPRVIQAGMTATTGLATRALTSPIIGNERGSFSTKGGKPPTDDGSPGGNLPKLPEGGGPGSEPVKPRIGFVLPETQNQVKKSVTLSETNKTLNVIEEKLKTSKLSPDAFNETLNLAHEDDTPFHLNMDEVDKLISKSSVAAKAFETVVGKRENIKGDTYVIGYKDLIKLRLANPEFNETWSTEPKGPSVSKAKAYLDELLGNVDAAEDIAESTTGKSLAEREAVAEGLAKPDVEQKPLLSVNPEQRAVKPIWTDANTKLIFPEKFVADFESKVRKVRVSAANEAIANKVDKIGRIVNLDNIVKHRLGVEAVTGNDQSLRYNATLNLFRSPPDSPSVQSKPNFDPTLADSVYAINPDTVPPDLSEYLTSGALLRNKVFKTKTEIERVTTNKAKGKTQIRTTVQKGADATEVAGKLGYQSVKDLFDALIIADQEQDVVNQFKEEFDSQESLFESVDEIGVTEDDILDAINNEVDLRRKEIRSLFDRRVNEINLVETENPVRPFKKEKGKVIHGVRGLTKEAILKTVRGFKSDVSLKLDAIRTARELNVRNSNPDVYRENANRQHKQAIEAAMRGEFEKSVRLSNSSLLNSYIEKELRKTNSKLDRNLTRVAKLSTKENMNTIARAPKPIVDVISKLMSVVEYNREYDTPTKETVDLFMKTNDPDAYYESLVDPNKPKATIRDLPIGTVVTMTDVLLDAFKAATEYNEVEVEFNAVKSVMNTEALVDEATKHLQSIPTYVPDRAAPPDDPNIIQKVGNNISDLTAALLRTETIVNLMDKGSNNEKGFFKGVLWQGVSDAYDRHRSMERSLKGYLHEKIGNFGSDEFHRRKRIGITDPRLTKSVYGKNRKTTKLDIFNIALNTGNEGNLKEMARSLKLSDEQVLDLVDKYMTKEDWSVVQGIWDSFDPLWDENVRTKREIGEDVPERVQPLSRKTSDGVEIKGGYFPLEYQNDGTQSDMKKLGKAPEDRIFKADMMTFNGHNIQREGGAKSPVKLDPYIWDRAISDITYDIAMRKPLRDLQKVLTNERLSVELRNALEPSQYSALLSWADAIKDAPKSQFSVERGMERVASELRRVTTLGSLGFSITTVLKQPEVLFRLRSKLGERFSGNNLDSVFSGYVKLTQNTAMMFTKRIFNINDISAQVVKENPAFAEHLSFELDKQKSIFDDPEKWHENNAFAMMRWMNSRINLISYLSAKALAEQGKITGVDPNNSKQVIDFANEIVRTVVESNRHIDKSASQRMSQVSQLLMPFYSAANVAFNQAYDNFTQARFGNARITRDLINSGRLKKTALRSAVIGTLMAQVFESVVLPTMYMQGVTDVVKGNYDKLLDPATQVTRLVTAPVKGLVQLVPGADSVAFALEQRVTGNASARPGVAGLSQLTDFGTTIMNSWDIFTLDAKAKDYQQAFKTAQALTPRIPFRIVSDLIKNPDLLLLPATPLLLLTEATKNTTDVSKNPPTPQAVNQAATTLLQDAKNETNNPEEIQIFDSFLKQIEDLKNKALSVAPTVNAELVENKTGLKLISPSGKDYTHVSINLDNPNGDKITHSIDTADKKVKLTSVTLNKSQLKRMKAIIKYVYIPVESKGDWTAVANIKANNFKNAAFSQGAAAGMFQFTRSTINLYNKRYGFLKNYPQLLESPYSLVEFDRPEDIKKYNEGQVLLTWLDSGEHYIVLKRNGLEATGTNLYAFHQLGTTELMIDLLTKPKSTPSKLLVDRIMSNTSVWSVGDKMRIDVEKMTHEELYKGLRKGLEEVVRWNLGKDESLQDKATSNDIVDKVLDVDLTTLK